MKASGKTPRGSPRGAQGRGLHNAPQTPVGVVVLLSKERARRATRSKMMQAVARPLGDTQRNAAIARPPALSVNSSTAMLDVGLSPENLTLALIVLRRAYWLVMSGVLLHEALMTGAEVGGIYARQLVRKIVGHNLPAWSTDRFRRKEDALHVLETAIRWCGGKRPQRGGHHVTHGRA